MALSLDKVIYNYKKTHSFDVKIALPLDSEGLDFGTLDAILEGKGMVDRKPIKKLPLTALPLCFRHLEDFVGEVYQTEMEFEYPMTATELRNEISTVMQINFNYIRVIPVHHPFLKDEENYYKYSEEDMMADAVATARDFALADGIKFDSKYPNEVIAALNSDKAKEEFKHTYREVDMSQVEKHFAKKDNK